MRSSIWMLAVCAFAWGAVSAQDRGLDRPFSPFDSSVTGRTVEYFSRGGKDSRPTEPSSAAAKEARPRDKKNAARIAQQLPKREGDGSLTPAQSIPSASSPKVRNYYEELFGKNGVVPPARSSRDRNAADRKTGDSRSTQLQPADGASNPTSQRSSEGNPFEALAADNVTPAKHDSSSPSDAGGVEPVAATSEENPFRAFEAERDASGETEPARADEAFAPADLGERETPVSEGSKSAARDESQQKVRATVQGPQSPSVTVEWATRGEINVGHESECELIVRNSGKVTAHDVKVDAWFPFSVRLLRTTPKPSATSDHVTWNFDSLAPGEEKSIQIAMIPNERGSLEVTANVRFTAAAAETLEVVEPLLNVAMKGASQAMVGDLVSQVITVSNPGSGTAHDVVVEVRIPEGLEHSRGTHLLTEVGSLNPGESRDLTLRMTAIAGGRQPIQVQARAGDELTQATVSEIDVVAPSLQLVADGPTLRYLGRSAKYTIDVINDGTTATSNVRVHYKVPKGFKFLRADHGGQYDESSRTIDWFVGGLEAAEKFTVGVELSAETLGESVHYIRTVSEQGAGADATIETRVEGTASLVLEIVDLDDPVEVGVETGYEIRIHNNGSAGAQNIGLSCELPNGTSILNVKGPADHIAENGVVVFKSLEELPPGKTALYHVHLRGSEAGDLRFRARLTSDSIQEPLIVEELTKYYAD